MNKLLTHTRKKRMYHAINVNMTLSFDGLSEMLTKKLGGEAEAGDIIVCDNATRTKRKMLQKTATGYMIFYGRLDNKTNFEHLTNKGGMVKRIDREIL